MSSLSSLKRHNRFADLGNDFSSVVIPTSFSDVQLVSHSEDMARILGIGQEDIEATLFTQMFSGVQPWQGYNSVAQLYAGHQFGVWVPQLGDGRAILLGELEAEDGQLWDIQVKGAGPTPYSRMGDGRAVLRSSIREFLCSEAMAALDIPTTRALALFHSESPVFREEVETGAVVTRVAQSHLRFGSFEVFYHRGQHDKLKTLLDFTISHYYPQMLDQENPYLSLAYEVAERTASLIAKWQLVGFCHGVMNTDNMSVLGLTLDYGPFGFLDAWDAEHICNHSDHQGRYAYNQQPQIGRWNLVAWLSCLLPFVEEAELSSVVEHYNNVFDKAYHQGLQSKLGLQGEQEGDDKLIGMLFELMQQDHPDYTILFRALSHFKSQGEAQHISDMFIQRDKANHWLRLYEQRLQNQSMPITDRHQAMQLVNPKYILRNYMAENAIKKARDDKDFSEVNTLLKLLSKPFDEQPEHEQYAALPPSWASSLSVSCSS